MPLVHLTPPKESGTMDSIATMWLCPPYTHKLIQNSHLASEQIKDSHYRAEIWEERWCISNRIQAFNLRPKKNFIQHNSARRFWNSSIRPNQSEVCQVYRMITLTKLSNKAPPLVETHLLRKSSQLPGPLVSNFQPHFTTWRSRSTVSLRCKTMISLWASRTSELWTETSKLRHSQTTRPIQNYPQSFLAKTQTINPINQNLTTTCKF